MRRGAIRSFGDATTADLFHGRESGRTRRKPAALAKQAARKLDVLNAAKDLADLRSPPGNRLEALRGDLRGYHSLRVNQRWRIVFRWQESEANDVRLTDYHA